MRSVLLAPILFFKWLLSLGLRTVVVGTLILAIGYGLLRYFDVLPDGDTATEAAGVPIVQEAPYVAETATRYYYARAYSQAGNTTTLDGYWELVGKGRRAEWQYRDEELVLTWETRVHRR